MNEDFQKSLFRELQLLLSPLQTAGSGEEQAKALLRNIGWNLDAFEEPPIIELLATFSSLYESVSQLADHPPQSLQDLLRALKTITPIMNAARNIHDLFASGGRTLPAEFLDVGNDLLTYLTIRYLAVWHTEIYELLVLLTVIKKPGDLEQKELVSPVLGTNRLLRFPIAIGQLRPDLLGPLLQDPVGTLKKEYLPNGLPDSTAADASADKLFPRIRNVLAAFGLQTAYGISDDDVRKLQLDLGSFGKAVFPKTLTVWKEFSPASIIEGRENLPSEDDLVLGASISLSPPDRGNLGVVVKPFGRLSADLPLEAWHLIAALAIDAGGFAVGPTGFVFLASSSGKATIQIRLVKLRKAGTPTFRIGSMSDTRLEVGGIAFNSDAELREVDQGYGVSFDLDKCTLVIQASDGDGFLQKIFPKDGIHLDFDLTVGWSNTKGLYFRGGAGLEATLPVNINLYGIIKIDSLYLALLAKSEEGKESKIQAVTATTVQVKLGPVSATVERFGLQATLDFPEKGGNLGVANLDLGFKSPKGVGLTINAQVVTGGGYLHFDKDHYAGVLQLEIAKNFSLTAVGLLTTKMPDGSKGFSLLVIISVRFNPGIQLGYGFSLNGLGGLLGVNRTANAEVLREGLRHGTLGSVLFPQNIVKNAPQVVSNLSTIFPPAQDRFLFGPMALIGWGGSPPILTMEIGIILELPEPVRLMILGRLRVTLPPKTDDSGQPGELENAGEEKKQEAPKIKLQLDCLGIFDFGTGDLSLDAYLYDSTIGPFTITGGMALRASFGAKPLFLLSVGGFHPAFQAPAGFPSLERVAIGLHKKESGVEVRLQLTAYFALTSNTVQFGAHFDLYVHVWEFEIIGLLAFDALIQFQPFGLMASFEAMVSVKAFGQTLMAVGLQVNVTGPSPWHVWGKAHFTLLLFSGTAEFDALIGQQDTPPLPPPIDVEQELFAELQKLGNWSSQLPMEEHPLVTFRDSIPSSNPSGTPTKRKVLIHPLAELHINQRLVPLNTSPITRYGTTTPTGATTFALDAVDATSADSAVLSALALSDWFARAQFYAMTDAEQLAAPSFEEMNSGVRIKADDGYACGKPVACVMKAARSFSSEPASELKAEKYLDRVAHLGAAGQAPLRTAGPTKYGDPSWWGQGITLRKAGYRVVGEGSDGPAPKARSTRRAGASAPSSFLEEAMGDMAAVAEPVMSFSAAQAQATRARQRSPQRRAWVVPDIGRKRG